MKKTVKILAVTLAAGMLGGLAACSGSSSSKITLDSYWYIDNYPGIQNSTLSGASEVLYYDITFEGDGNGVYSVEYDNDGYYRTELTAATFDWSEDTIDKYKSSESNAETVYMLTTVMEVSGRYIYTYDGSNTKVEFNDYVLTVTYFRSARNTLSPLYSWQSVRSTSPNDMLPTASNMCATVQYEYEVFYNQEATEATFTYTEYDPEKSTYKNGDIADAIGGNKTISEIFEMLENSAGDKNEDECFEKTVSGLDGDYSMLDNNTLYMAVRGMSLSSSFSAVVSLFIPAESGTFDVSITGGNEGTLDEDSTIYTALTNAYGEPDDDESISYNTVSITANSTLSGTSQTAWYAAVEDEDNNQYRATLLYLEVPLSYSLGTLQYTLKSVDSVLGTNTTSTNS